jgi:hypothetical protein
VHGDLCNNMGAYKDSISIQEKCIFSLQYCYFQIRKIEAYTVLINTIAVFSRSVFTKGGCLQISSANRKSANLRTRKICSICGPSANVTICEFATCRFADLKFADQIFF